MQNAIVILTFVISTVCIHAQIESLYIEVRTDHKPEEIGWNITNEMSDTLLTDLGVILEPQKVYIWEFRVRKGDCLRFEIIDKGNDGIDAPGYYRIRRGNIWLQGQVRPFQNNNLHYSGNCSKGKFCDNPMPVTSNIMYASIDVSDYWFLLSSQKKINYNINTCKSLDDSLEIHTDTQIWIYDGCPNEISNGPEGALAYNDNFVSCAPGSGLAQYPIKEGRDYLVRISYTGQPRGDLIPVVFDAAEDIMGCMDSASCTYNPFATIDNGTCLFDDDCAPDLAIGQSEYIKSIYLDTIIVEDPCLLEESCVNGMGLREVIRFTTVIYNVGDADYIVGNPELDSQGFSIDNCHEHWHRLGYAEYLLYKDEGKPLPLGFKNGFCLLDISCKNENLFPKYYCDYMGISAGCFDVYDASVECQWLDITDVADGTYTMVARINWNKFPDIFGRYEKTYDNNWAQACITLDRSSGQLQIQIEENCESYYDCFGAKFGDAIEDCDGICGGIAHYGDINRDNVLDSMDYWDYLLALEDKGVTPNNCNDLDGNGMLTVYDAILIADCIKYYDESDPIHNHCLFPKSLFDNQSKASIFIEDHDAERKEVTLSYKSEKAIVAFHLKMDGLSNVISVTNLIAQEVILISNHENEIIGIYNNEPFPASLERTPLLTITYDSLTSNSVCISNIIDLISIGNHKIISINELPECSLSTSTNDILDNKIFTIIYPNPASAKIHITLNEGILSTVEIYNIAGKLKSKSQNIISKPHSMNVSLLNKGLYFIKLNTSRGVIFHKFVKL
ncbi:MAG: lysyl oxidase family protein [Saprospiraceae bacterium]